MAETETFLTDADLAERYRISRASVWRWARRSPGFPPAVRLSKGCTRWRLADVQAWEAAQAVA